MNIDELTKLCQEENTSVHQTRILLKLILYAYSIKIYNSSKIAKEVKEDVHFMWLNKMSKLDYHTIHKFCSGKAKDLIEKLFIEMLKFLVKQEYIIAENYFNEDNLSGDETSKQKIPGKKNEKLCSRMWIKNAKNFLNRPMN